MWPVEGVVIDVRFQDVRWSQWPVIDDVEVPPRPREAIGVERRDEEVVRIEDAVWRWIRRRKQGAVDIREDHAAREAADGGIGIDHPPEEIATVGRVHHEHVTGTFA
jgi:hypothetical protein